MKFGFKNFATQIFAGVKKFFTLSLVATLLPIISIQAIFPQSAHAAACSSGATSGVYTISPSHGQVFYIDTGITPRLDAAYAGYIIQTSSAKSDLWVQLSNFSGGQVSLANSKDYLQQIASLSAGAANAKTAYFLLKATGTSTTTDQIHRMTLYEGNPNRGGTSVYTCDFTFTEIQETIKASANKVQTISVPSSNPSLGSLVSVVVTGTMGTPGQGKTPDNDIMWVTPSGFSTWPTSALRLESSNLILDQDGTFTTTNDQNSYNDKLLVTGINSLKPGSANKALDSGSQYKATYNFRVIGSVANAFKVAPVAQISSGTQYKHSDTTNTAAGAFPSLDLSGVASNMTVNKKISPSGRITNKELLSNVATLTTQEAHGLSVNDQVYILGVGTPFNGLVTIASVPTATTFTYSLTNTDISSTALSPIGYVYKKDGSNNAAIVPYEISVSSTATTAVDEIVDTPDSGMTFVAGSAQIKDVNRVTFTSISDPALDSTETSLSPRPKHFTGPFYSDASTTIFLRYKLSIPTTSTATYSNTAFARSGSQIVGANAAANPKIVINTVSGGVVGTSETTANADPVVTTLPVSALGSTTATITGSVDPNGNTVNIKFQYSLNSDLSSSTDATSNVTSSSSSSTVNITSNLTGLTSNTTYYYRAVISYGAGPTVLNGEILSFKTNLQGSTSQAITWSLSTLTYDLGATSSLTQATNTSDGGATFTSGAVYSNSGLLVDLISSTSSVCTVASSTDASGNVTYTISFLTTGTCTLTASQAGNGTYAAATDVVKDLTITKKYTVTFDGNSQNAGTTPSSSSLTQTTVGGSITLATVGTLAKTGYSFGGWYTNTSGTGGTAYTANTSYTPTQDITLYAKWNLNSYTISYSPNTGGSGSAPTSPTSVNHGATFVVPSNNSYVKSGYTFSGWSDGTNNYAAGATYPTSGTVSGNVTLTAQWTINTYTLTYTAGSGGTLTGTTSQTVNYGSNGTAVTPVPNSGYHFVNWDDGSTTNPRTDTNVQASATYIANFALDNAQRVFYNDNVSSEVITVPTDANNYLTGNTVTISATEPSRSGYTFSGWTLDSTNTGTLYKTGSANNSVTVASSDITFYAKWTANNYTVTYNNNTGSGSRTAGTYTPGGSALPLADGSGFSKDGYTFGGWSTTQNNAATIITTYSSNSSITVYAIWTANKYVYDGNTGTGSAPADQTYSGSQLTGQINTFTAPSGYTFDGWCTTQPSVGGSCGGSKYLEGDNLSAPSSSTTTLYAIWKTTSGGGGGGGAPAPVYVPHPPTITSISDSEVCALNSQLTIIGTYLSGAAATVDGVAAKVLSSSYGELFIVLPDAAPGIKTIKVTNADGSVTTSVKYKFVDTPEYVNFTYPEMFKDVAFTYTFAATGAASYSVIGKLPAGLTLNPLTGELSGTPVVDGEFQFTIVANNICDNAYLDVYMLIDKAIPDAFTCSVAFNVPSSNNISEVKLTALKNCFEKIIKLGPTTLDPVLFLSGGVAPGLTTEELLNHPRYLAICQLLNDMGIIAQIVVGAFDGPLDQVQIMAYWPVPFDV